MLMWSPSEESESPSNYSGATDAADSRIWMAPGTCGEFLQGRLDGADFLINCPIDRYSTATVRRSSRPGISVMDAATRTKVANAMSKLSERLWITQGFEIEISSDLPLGKGMASSTADLVAAIGAALAHAEADASIEEIARLLVEVEPSDCTHVPGIGYIGHLCGTVFGKFPAPDNLRVLIVDCGGVVETAEFDRARAHHVYARNEPLLRCALSMAMCGLAEGNAALLACASTISARLSQQILPKSQFDDLLAISDKRGGLGVNCAHSGSVLGLIYQPTGDLGLQLRDAVEGHFGTQAPIIGDHQFVSGGIHVRNRR